MTQSCKDSLNKHPSFVNSPEEFEKLLAQCPFMSIIRSQAEKKTSVKRLVKNKSLNEQNISITNSLQKQLSVISSDKCEMMNQSEDNSCTYEVTTQDNKVINIVDNHPKNLEKIEDHVEDTKTGAYEEITIKDEGINNSEHQTKTLACYFKSTNERNTNNVNYLNSLSSIKKLRLTKEFNSLSIGEQNEEQTVRQKQLDKLHELIQSDPGRYGQLSIENIHEQMEHYYL
ncbi:steroid dehydrogenase [Schistosoma japonicum]|nr:steroid dehydrogenase [Schistosoma japonicum]